MLTLDGQNLDTITHFYSYQYSDTRQVLSKDEGTSAVEFTADVKLEDLKAIQGATFTYDATGSSENIIGVLSNFAADLRAGDRIYFTNTKYVDVDAINPATLQTTNNGSIFDNAAQKVNVTPAGGGAAPSAGTYTTLIRYRAALNDKENAHLFLSLIHISEPTRPY